MRDADAVTATRHLLRRAAVGTLATLLSCDDAAPYASVAAFACDADGSPLFLFSTLSEHTRNLAEDARASFLVAEVAGRRNPQTGPRLSLQGFIKPTSKDTHRMRYLARHPDAKMYAGFADFGVYRMTVRKAHFVGGFARAHWLPARRLMTPRAAAKAVGDASDAVCAHMNDDHASSIDLYANVLLGRRGTGWTMTGVDPDGADLRLAGRYARLPFDTPAADRGDVRQRLVELVGVAERKRRT